MLLRTSLIYEAIVPFVLTPSAMQILTDTYSYYFWGSLPEAMSPVISTPDFDPQTGMYFCTSDATRTALCFAVTPQLGNLIIRIEGSVGTQWKSQVSGARRCGFRRPVDVCPLSEDKTKEKILKINDSENVEFHKHPRGRQCCPNCPFTLFAIDRQGSFISHISRFIKPWSRPCLFPRTTLC